MNGQKNDETKGGNGAALSHSMERSERRLMAGGLNRSRGRGYDPTLEVKVRPVTRFMLANEAILRIPTIVIKDFGGS